MSRAAIRTLVLAGAVIVCAVTAIGLVNARAHDSAPPTNEERRIAALDYPTPSPVMPDSITLAYNAPRARSRLRLLLRPVVASSTVGIQVSDVELELTSRFSGEAREQGRGELSIQGDIRCNSPHGGALAPSIPPVMLFADGAELDCRTVAPGEAGYHTAQQSPGPGTREHLEFKVNTDLLVRAAAAKSLTLKAGSLEITPTQAQARDIREFIARLAPKR